MQLEVSKDIAKRIDSVSKEFGINKRQIIDRAILLYLETIKEYLNLRKEIKEWDNLSDEALINFEKAL